MSRTCSVRPVTREDYHAWRPLWDGYNAFYGRSGLTALPEEITLMTWSRFFDSSEPVNALVAETSEGIVGIANYVFHRSTTQLALTCYLQDLFTSESARGSGVGRSLIEAVYHAARRAGLPRVYWHTHGTNQQAIALYDKLAESSGFVVYRKLL